MCAPITAKPTEVALSNVVLLLESLVTPITQRKEGTTIFAAEDCIRRSQETGPNYDVQTMSDA